MLFSRQFEPKSGRPLLPVAQHLGTLHRLGPVGPVGLGLGRAADAQPAQLEAVPGMGVGRQGLGVGRFASGKYMDIHGKYMEHTWEIWWFMGNILEMWWFMGRLPWNLRGYIGNLVIYGKMTFWSWLLHSYWKWPSRNIEFSHETCCFCHSDD